jgi:hypothetical protein
MIENVDHPLRAVDGRERERWRERKREVEGDPTAVT